LTPKSWLPCRGRSEEVVWFGKDATDFRGESGFVEYLFTLSDNPVVVRHGDRMNTRQFLDMLTTKITLIAVVYSAEYATASLLVITGDFASPRPAVRYKIRHFQPIAEDMHGVVLTLNAVLMGCLLFEELRFSLAAIFKDRFVRVPEHFRWPKYRHVVLIDIVLLALIIVISFVHYWLREESSYILAADVGAMTDLQWGSRALTMQEKLSLFLTTMLDLEHTIDYEEVVTSLLFVIFFVIVLRMTYFMGLHPRLALMNSTIVKSMDKFCHFALVFAVVQGSLTVIGIVSFGDAVDGFGTVSAAFTSNYVAMTSGEFVDSDSDSLLFFLFQMAFVALGFFFMLNFILAIVCGAHDEVQEDIASNVVELSITSDIWLVLLTHMRAVLFGWPLREAVVNWLEKEAAEKVVISDFPLAYFGGGNFGGKNKLLQRQARLSYFTWYFRRYSELREKRAFNQKSSEVIIKSRPSAVTHPRGSECKNDESLLSFRTLPGGSWEADTEVRGISADQPAQETESEFLGSSVFV